MPVMAAGLRVSSSEVSAVNPVVLAVVGAIHRYSIRVIGQLVHVWPPAT